MKAKIERAYRSFIKSVPPSGRVSGVYPGPVAQFG
jgi:hypothetical protein